MATASVLEARDVLATINRAVPVFVPKIEIYKNQQVVWSTHHDDTFKVVFDEETPFQESTYTVRKGDHVHSGPVKKDVKFDYLYKYSIKDEFGKTLVDPEIVIRQ